MEPNRIQWTKERQPAFEELQLALSTYSTLKRPDPEKLFMLQTGTGTGAVLHRSSR